MKALFIGGTGTISSAVSQLAVEKGWELYLLNRGNKKDNIPKGANIITADINDEKTVAELIKGMKFDVVADFIAFVPSHIERDIRLFSKNTKQFIFISSASAYQKPLLYYKINESTPLINPYWDYSRNKIACEDILMKEYRNNNFPITIIRPSHTYSKEKIPVAIHGEKGSWQVIDRIRKGKPVIIPGDGTSLWTLTYNLDFAKAFVGIMGNSAAIGETIHITSDEALTWNKIYDCIGEAFGVEVKKVHISSDFIIKCNPDFKGPLLGDKSNCAVFDNSKIKRLVPDFNATTRFDEGVKICAEYILSNPKLQVIDEEFDKFCDNIIEAQEKAIELFKNM
ncbi:Nucleoside-diphosphate-sugar epimerase [Clostridium sp. USBA 49]|uniref:SDR family oxidoreductase n=1 Tax=Clostridium sp. USBA 49 TaxID=1881060 RepID=UPI00099ABB22|nr:SDR family oxidoreductase [Clostridium sp. USBA 49]SKA73615.1 Nucleoside-diphosphate-sugar epimerase [Clostridium sp. USBA 49]